MPVVTRQRKQQQQQQQQQEQFSALVIASAAKKNQDTETSQEIPNVVVSSFSSSIIINNNDHENNQKMTPTTPIKTRKKRKLSTNNNNDGSSQQTNKEEEEEETPAKLSKNNDSPKKATTTTTTINNKKKEIKVKSSNKQKKRTTKSKKSLQPVGSKQPPENWKDIYSLVEELRQDRSAPVDSDGSEALPEKQNISSRDYRFQVLICLMLSSQTKDHVVGETVKKLQQHGLNIETISNDTLTPPETLNKLIHKVGFHNNKTKYIKQTCQILKEKYDCDIPKTAQEMIQDLPGVGPKMAFITENVAWGTVSGIGVDTHMHRMFNQLGWVQSKTPEQTRIQLESWLPQEKWSSVNLLWVGFGQEVQQYKPKMLRKVLNCSRPIDGLKLIKKLGLDYVKEGKRLDMMNEINTVLQQQQQQQKTTKD